MDRFVVMVDAGYLLRQSIEIVSQKQSNKRAELKITDPAGLLSLLISKCRAALDVGNRELLRVYWYDGVMANGYTPQQRLIIDLPDLHFRGGTVNGAGQQKGVDSLIVTDLIELASNHAICDAALVTGDSDLAVGIEISQKKGVRVAVIGLEDLSVRVSHNQSFEITSRADRVGRIGSSELSSFMHYAPPPAATATATATQSQPAATPTIIIPNNIKVTAAAPPQPALTTSIPPSPASHQHSPAPTARPRNTPLGHTEKQLVEQAVKEFISLQASIAGAIDPSTKRIESAVDRALIHHVFVKLGLGPLTNDEKNHARDVLRAELGV